MRRIIIVACNMRRIAKAFIQQFEQQIPIRYLLKQCMNGVLCIFVVRN